MKNKLCIKTEEINNGYLTTCTRGHDYIDTVYHPDIEGVIKFIDDTYGEIHRQLKKIHNKEEK